jgi:hypothetical protein
LFGKVGDRTKKIPEVAAKYITRGDRRKIKKGTKKEEGRRKKEA